MSADRRVVVTGIGMMCAIGASRDEVWRNMLAGRCGVAPVTRFDAAGYRSAMVAEIPAYPRDEAYSLREWGRWSGSDHTALIASREALEDAGIASSLDPSRVAVAFGSGTADLVRNEEWFAEADARDVRHATPRKIFNHFPSTPVDVVASAFGFIGPKVSALSACSSSTVAIGHAGDLVRGNRADIAIAGASDALCRLTLSGFNALRLVDTEPCRPFCRTRKGMNIGEAAAVLVLEEFERAKRRGARIYAELAGYGACCEAYHATSPEPDGHAVAAMIRSALRAARVPADAVDHVNAHGTATPQNDRAEARGIRIAFGDRGARSLPVTSVKSMVGHCLAAAGAVEAATLALSLFHGVVPPTIHYREADPDCDLDIVANEARALPITCGVSTSLAFGGNNAALVMRRVEQPLLRA